MAKTKSNPKKSVKKLDIKQTLKELYAIDSAKIKLGLDGIQKLLKALENPEKDLKYIHVAGTNGKGSVSIMMQSILMKAGYSVGVYTSPHLKQFNERIRINNTLISDKEIVDLYTEIKPHVKKQSFFEITTTLAFLHFLKKKPDFVILEVGLGGRLDATNVITPLVSIITNIGLEHQNILGKTIKKIALEKASIIKPKVPVVTAATGEALPVIQSFAKKKKAPVTIVEDSNIAKKFDVQKQLWTFSYGGLEELQLDKLPGGFQIKNAVTAIAAIDILAQGKTKITEKHVRDGLKTASWPGRFQVKGNTIIDVAHNADGFVALFDEVKRRTYEKLIVVVGLSDNRDVEGIMELLKFNADQIIITKANNPRSIDPKEIAKQCEECTIVPDAKKAVQKAKKLATNKDLVVVAGSIYMIGEVI